jgi:hypothetical protein
LEKDIKEGRLPEQNIINYANFSHYKDVILSNWKIFSLYFGGRGDWGFVLVHGDMVLGSLHM